MNARKSQNTTARKAKISRKDLKPVVLGGIAPTTEPTMDNELEALTKGAGIQGNDDGEAWYVW